MLVDSALSAVAVLSGVVESVIVVCLLNLASDYCDYVDQEERGQCGHCADWGELLYWEFISVFAEVDGDEGGEEYLGEQAGALNPA